MRKWTWLGMLLTAAMSLGAAWAESKACSPPCCCCASTSCPK